MSRTEAAAGAGDPGAAVVARLRAAGCVFAEDEAALLRAAAPTPAELDALVDARVAGTPLEHLLGWAEFDGRRMRVAPRVFVPRRRSELLVQLAVASAPRDGVVVELCAGVAAIATAVRFRRPDLTVWAAELDPVALDCARTNLGAPWVLAGDLYGALPDDLRADVLVANAPYVPTAEIAFMPSEAREHEARLALDGGADGLDVHRRLLAGARERWRPGGVLIVETSRRQAPIDVALGAEVGLVAEVHTDDALDATAVLVRARTHPATLTSG